ncbi:hypothetical protein Hanom_Chr15g01406501 [Helianthus anomalus]
MEQQGWILILLANGSGSEKEIKRPSYGFISVHGKFEMNLIDEQNLSLQQFVESLTLCFLDVVCKKKSQIRIENKVHDYMNLQAKFEDKMWAILNVWLIEDHNK